MLVAYNMAGDKMDPKNLKKQPVPSRKVDRPKGIINWETNRSKRNDFPQQLIQNVHNSPVGSAAIDVWGEFVEGDGLLDKTAGETVINEKTGQTLDDLHALWSVDLASLDGFSFIQRYNSEGKPSQREHLPFEEARLGIQDDENEVNRIFHNPYYGIPKDFKEKDTRWFYDFNPDLEHVKQEIENHNIEFNKDGEIDPAYPGQAFWFSIEKPLARVYPQPFYYSAVNWFQVDAEIQLFHERNIKNNLLLSVLINMQGDPSAPAGPQQDQKDTTDKTLDQRGTVGEEMDQQMKIFQSEKGGIFMNWFKKDEEKATFEAFPTNSHHDLFTVLQNITADQISIGTKVPRVILGIGESGKLGDTQEIVNAHTLMQGRTKRKRNILKRVYERVFDFVTDGTIKTISLDIIPDQIWEVLTTEEKRKHAAEKFNVELIESSNAIVTDPVIEDPILQQISKRILNGKENSGLAGKDINKVMSMYYERNIELLNTWKKYDVINDKQKWAIDRVIESHQEVIDKFKIAS